MNLQYFYALSLGMVECLFKHGSWCGETHIQKNMYILDNIFDQAHDLNFTLYKHGPYSFVLHDIINDLYGFNFIGSEQCPPYGPHISITEAGRKFVKKHILPYDKMEIITSIFAKETVQGLEKKATALMLEKQMPQADPNSRADRLNKIKPHISIDDALTVTREMDELKKKLLANSIC